MRKVKFLQDYENHKEGDIIRISREEAERLKNLGIVTYYI